MIRDLRKEKKFDEFAGGGNLNIFVKKILQFKQNKSKKTTRLGKRKLLDEYEEIEDSSVMESKIKPTANEPCVSLL